MTKQRDRVRLGVVGVGKFGENHLRLLRQQEDVEIIGISDGYAPRLAEMSAKYEVPACGSHRELLGHVQGVLILTPTVMHAELAAEFLQAGAQVFVEKPMTASLAEAERLESLCAKSGCFVQVGHIERFNPIVRAFTPLPAVPLYLEIDRLNTFPKRSLDVDVVMDLMIHDLDLLRLWVPFPVVEVQAVGHRVLSEKLDIVSARLTFANGSVATVNTSRVSLLTQRKARLMLPGSYLSLDLVARSATTARPCAATPAEPYGSFAVEAQTSGESNALLDELRAFVAAIRGEAPPPVTVLDGKEAVALALRVLAAVEAHQQRFPEQHRLAETGLPSGKPWSG